jgi:hypothetical protein
LISLWPINPHNDPDGEPEKQGLEAVRAHPERSATSTVKIGDQTYFKAIYADRAISQSCVSCRNTHPRSPKKDFKLNEVMGGLMIEISLESSVSMYHKPIRQKVSGILLLDDRLRASSNETLDDCACVPSNFSFEHAGQ